MAQINRLSPAPALPTAGAAGNLGVLVADAPREGAKAWDHKLAVPVKAVGPDGRTFQVSLVERVYGHGETRYFVDGVALGQTIKTEAAARAEVARLVGEGKFCQSLAAEQKASKGSRQVALTGGSDLVQTPVYAGKRTNVEIAERQQLINGKWQVTGYVAKRVSAYSVERYADSKPRTAYGYPLESRDNELLILNSDGSACASIGQTHQRVRELVATGSLTTVSQAEVNALKSATPLPKATVDAMNKLDRVKYLLQETLRQLPASAANELRAMLTSPETWAVMGAFLVAGAIPGLNVAAMVVGALLLGNDALDTGGKMVDAVKSALDASTKGELVNAGKALAEALVHSAVIVASPVIGKRMGQAINATWKANTTGEAIAWRNFKRNVELRKKDLATDTDVARAAGMLVQAKRNTAAKGASTNVPTNVPQTQTRTPVETVPDVAAIRANTTQHAMAAAAENTFTDPTLRSELASRLAKDSRTNPSKNGARSIDPQAVQAAATQLVMPKLLGSVFGQRRLTRSAIEAFTARAVAWAKQESPSNPAGALERLIGSPVVRMTMVRATVIDQLTGSSVASLKALGASQPTAARALSARRQRLADSLDRSYPDTASQARLLEQSAGVARTALLREQAGIELGGSTPLATAVQAQLKAQGTGERDLINLPSSPKARISTLTRALVEQWRGSSGTEPLLDGKSQRTLRKAIETQLAGIPGDIAKEQYLKDLAASGQTRARMARGEVEAGGELRKPGKAQTTMSEQAPSQRLALPSTLRKAKSGGVEIDVDHLTANQQAHYMRLLQSNLSAADINDIVNKFFRSGIDGLLSNPKYLNLSADNLACLMHMTTGLDDATALHDVTHMVLSGRHFKYGALEVQETIGNTAANQYIDGRNGIFKPFKWVKGADGKVNLSIDRAGLAAVRKVLNSIADTSTVDRTLGFRDNFEINSYRRTVDAASSAVDSIGQRGSTFETRYQQLRAQLEASGQLPGVGSPQFEKLLLQKYVDIEAALARSPRGFTKTEWHTAVTPMVKLLSQEAALDYQKLSASTKRLIAIDGMASVLTAAGLYPGKVGIPKLNAKGNIDTERFSREWTSLRTEKLNSPGYVRKFIEVRNQLRNELGDGAP